MGSLLRSGLVLALFACSAFGADDVASAVTGTVKTVDKATKTAKQTSHLERVRFPHISAILWHWDLSGVNQKTERSRKE
jgi:hypothetical protein